MTETALTVADQPETDESVVHSAADRYDGSRTSPDVQYEIMRRHTAGMLQADICRQVGCDYRTVKAVIANWGNTAHRLRLEAHKAKLIDAVLLSWDESAKRGKSDSLRGWTDSLGITEPTKGNTPSVAIQVNLHGGALPDTMNAQALAQTDAKVSAFPAQTSVVLDSCERAPGAVSVADVEKQA